MLSIILDVESPPFVRIVLEKKTAPFGGCMLFANQQKKKKKDSNKNPYGTCYKLSNLVAMLVLGHFTNLIGKSR